MEITLDKSEMDELELEIRSDPVKWAYWKLKDPKGNPWKARWYQKQILDDIMGGVTRVASRMGRRVGKTDSMIIYALWYAQHHKNSRVLIAAPYEHQVRMIFMRINELVRDCDELQGVHSTKNPFISTFPNGSNILGFTVGDEGASLRGQRANIILLDREIAKNS